MRLIDADALMKTLGITDMDCGKCAWRDKEWNLCNRGSDFEDACCAIENAPTIEERKTGKWNWIGFNIECSECGCMPCFDSTEPLYNYCPNCGADMREENR